MRYNPASIGNQDVITHSQASPAFTGIKAASRSHTCVLAIEGSALKVFRFDTTATLVQDLVATGGISDATVVNANNAAYDMAVADNCAAIRINNVVYHSNSAAPTFSSTVVTAAGAGWANPVYNEDFSIAVADAAIFKFNEVAGTPPTRSYVSAFTTATLANKKVWSSGDKLLVLSWAVTGTATIFDYTVKAYVASAATYVLVGSITGQYYGANPTDVPSISVSSTLQTVVVYHRNSGNTANTAVLKTFDYTART